MMRWLRSGALLSVLAVGGCGSAAATLNTFLVERGIAASILSEHHLYTLVSCPQHEPQRAGTVFSCTASLDAGKYNLKVTEVDGKGHVRWSGSGPLVTLQMSRVANSIVDSIRAQRHLHATVTCPHQVLQQAGVAFRCTALVGAKRYPFAVTEVDGNGHVRYVGLSSA